MELGFALGVCCRPIAVVAHLQPEVGSPTPFSQFLFTASTTPLPAGSVVLVASQRAGATRKAVLGCLAEQLWLKSSDILGLGMPRRVPRQAVADHGVEDGQQLAHARHDEPPSWACPRQEALVERADHGVVRDGHMVGHVHHCAHFGTPAPDVTLAPARTRVVGQGRHARPVWQSDAAPALPSRATPPSASGSSPARRP